MNNPYKKTKINKNTKITLIIYLITAILSLTISMLITSFVMDKPDKVDFVETPLSEENVRVNSEEFNAQAEKSQIDSLIKSYITASVFGEKSILLELTTGEFKTQLEGKDIKKIDNIKFLSNTLSIETISLSELEGMFSIKYVLEYNNESTQQNQIFYTIKENNRWKISNLTNEQ
jgi:hypothetical protein